MSPIGTKQSQRQLWIILLVVFCGTVGLSMPYLIFPALFLDVELGLLGADWSASARGILLGLSLAAYPLGQFIGSPILGALSDEHGRKPILSASLLIATLSCLVTALAVQFHIFWLLLVSRFVMGLMEGNMAIARAMAADLKDIDKHSSFGRINVAASMAWLLGPLIGGLLCARSLEGTSSIATPFYVMTALFLLQALLVAVALQRGTAKAIKPKRTVLQRINFPKRIGELLHNQSLSHALILATAFTLAVDTFFEFGPVFLVAEWKFDPNQLALYNGLLCVALMAGSGWLVTKARNLPLGSSLAVAASSFALSLIATVSTNNETVLLSAYTLAGIGLGFTATKLTIVLSDSATENIQGEVMGVQSSLRQLGDAVICLIGGVLLSVSASYILLVAALVALAVGLACKRAYTATLLRPGLPP